MITGRQLREALRLAGLQPAYVAAQAGIGVMSILDGLAGTGAVRLTLGDESWLRGALGEAGIIILPEHGGDLGVRKLPAPAPSRTGSARKASGRPRPAEPRGCGIHARGALRRHPSQEV